MALSQNNSPAPAHCHHYGRQRPLGKAAGSAPHRRSRRRGGSLPRIANYCRTLGVEYLTVYAFSTENWKRSAEEVTGIMKLLRRYLEEALRDMEKNQVKFDSSAT